MKIACFLFALLLIVATSQNSSAQQAPQQNPPTVSGFGTSFVFGPTPTCSGCLQTELGILKQPSAFSLPLVVTHAPNSLKDTDVTFLFEGLNKTQGVTHFGNQMDVVIRKKVFSNDTFIISAAPRGSVKLRGGGTSKLGATLAVQYTKGKNVLVSNLTGQKLFNSSSSASFQNAFDYSRIVHKSGTNVFAGFQQNLVPGQKTTWDLEIGLAIPYKNKQFEIEYAKIDVRGQKTNSFQARFLINWGRIK